MTKSQESALRAIYKYYEERQKPELHLGKLIVHTKDSLGEFQIFNITARGKTELCSIVPTWFGNDSEQMETSIRHIKSVLKFSGVNCHVSDYVKSQAI